jgi:hypothetical protein
MGPVDSLDTDERMMGYLDAALENGGARPNRRARDG